MAISDTDVKHIANLAHLSLGEQEQAGYVQDLNNIFEIVASMQKINTDNIEPMSHALNLTQRLREDHVTETDQRETFLKIAPQSAAGLYLVPKVIE